MEATFKLVRKTYLEVVAESNDKDAKNALIARKKIALKEAIENAEFYKELGQDDMADNEITRAKRLIKDIKKLN